MNSIDIPRQTVTYSPFVEAVAAVWRIEQSLDEQPGPRQPVVGKAQTQQFIDQCIEPSEYCLLKNALKSWNLYRVLQFGFISGNYDNEELGPLYSLSRNPQFNNRVMGQLDIMYEQYGIRLDKIKNLYNGSLFWETSYLHKLLEGNSIQLNLIPSVFMLPAPRGQTGFLEFSDGYDMTLVFGCTGPINEDTATNYPNWNQWFRNGVWHFLARSYWTRKMDGYEPIDSGLLGDAYGLLKEANIVKVDISNFVISEYKDWYDYAIDNLVFATRLMCEKEVGGEHAYQEKRKWYYSLGRFQIDWFSQILEPALKGMRLRELCLLWIKEVAPLLKEPAGFIGPLGACENPLWSSKVKIVFSPSISHGMRRAVRVWIANFWRIKPELLDSKMLDNISEDSSHLIFAVLEDIDWLEEIKQNISISWDADGLDALLFVQKNGNQNQYWSRVTISKSEYDLLKLNQQANIYMDWAALRNEEVLSGIHIL
ncbi:hypothetical protein D3P09_21320 [Paenibacillus pinisoli]|uniref:Uncharacterized protein n=1 Tax=Paenibacillus pinisoli TaxID=1276110 RepID=A0A3A6PBH0_9BACL|nr:hypothetical protein [Paenibacillus pinisoli]RJX37525.1 hypothetical protein D3P09_21320 [Paenibacillus pinisoli]